MTWAGIVSGLLSVLKSLFTAFVYLAGKKAGEEAVVLADKEKEAEVEKEYAQVATDAVGAKPSDTAGRMSSGSF